MIIKCDMCGSEIKRKPSAVGKTNFCSKKCHYKFAKGKPNGKNKTGKIKICPVCKKEFYVTNCLVNKVKYCSKECRSIGMIKGMRTCPVCKKEFYAKGNPSKRKYCSRKCSSIRRATGKFLFCLHCNKKIYRAKGRIESQERHFCSRDCANHWQLSNQISYICKVCGKEFKWSLSRTKTNNPTYCSIKCRSSDPEWVRNASIKANMVQQYKKGLNKLELNGRSILNQLQLEFDEQVLIADKFLVDVFVPKYNLIIQWDGDYWHGHKKYQKLNEIQNKRKRIDKSQNAYFKKCGYALMRFWETDVKKEVNNESDYIRKTIQTFTRSFKGVF